MKPTPDTILLQARSVTKRWPGVVALDGVSLNIYSGRVNALVGENGAGKSTLMNILSGVYPDYEGEVLMDGQPIHFSSTADAQRAGVTMVHQELNLIPQLNVAENIFLGREPLNRLGLVDYDRMHSEAQRYLHRVGFTHDSHTTLSDLKVGEQQLVEIAKALSLEARVMIFDEPTSSLSEQETQTLFRLIDELKAEGVGLVYITHKMDELSRLADYVTVLRDGQLIGEHRVHETTTDEIVRLMVGRERKDLFVKNDHPKGDVALAVCGLSLEKEVQNRTLKLENISFEVRRGEVVGIYGLMGAGRTEVLETIFGLHGDEAQGSLRIAGRELMPRSPREAMDAGIALIPEDRKHDGLVLGMDIARNTTLASIGEVLRWGGIDRRKEEAEADRYRAELAIKSHSCHQLTGELSGGNQQKVVLAKMLRTEPQVLLLDEPTRGIDINAKNEIYKLIDRLASEGRAVVVVSSEMPEIMALSDRILTLSAGRLTATFNRNEFSEERLLKASLPTQ
ncbi:MAG: sugar ABC transporter ATP-binding protein [Alistipes sp.]|nr:sugar ABC transporter ATP-binding protein [Alistipes sp.]